MLAVFMHGQCERVRGTQGRVAITRQSPAAKACSHSYRRCGLLCFFVLSRENYKNTVAPDVAERKKKEHTLQR